MEIGKINIDIETVQTLVKSLNDKSLKLIADKYYQSLDNLLITLSIPLSFMALGMRKSKAFHFSLQDALSIVIDKNGTQEKAPKKVAEDLVKHFQELLESKEYTIEQADEKIK